MKRSLVQHKYPSKETYTSRCWLTVSSLMMTPGGGSLIRETSSFWSRFCKFEVKKQEWWVSWISSWVICLGQLGSTTVKFTWIILLTYICTSVFLSIKEMTHYNNRTSRISTHLSFTSVSNYWFCCQSAEGCGGFILWRALQQGGYTYGCL